MICHIRWSRNCLWWPVYIYTRNDGLSSTDALSANQTDVLNSSFFFGKYLCSIISTVQTHVNHHISRFSLSTFSCDEGSWEGGTSREGAAWDCENLGYHRLAIDQRDPLGHPRNLLVKLGVQVIDDVRLMAQKSGIGQNTVWVSHHQLQTLSTNKSGSSVKLSNQTLGDGYRACHTMWGPPHDS